MVFLFYVVLFLCSENIGWLLWFVGLLLFTEDRKKTAWFDWAIINLLNSPPLDQVVHKPFGSSRPEGPGVEGPLLTPPEAHIFMDRPLGSALLAFRAIFRQAPFPKQYNL